MSDTPTETQPQPSQATPVAVDEPPTEPAAQPEPSKPAKADTDWKAEARKWEDRAKANSAKVAEYDKLVEASRTEQERAVSAARAEGESAAQQRFNARIVASETKALAAAARFRDPADALAQLRDRLNEFEVDADGNVDADTITAALADLAAAKPYLIADDGPPPPAIPRPDPSQGPRSTPQGDDALYAQFYPDPTRK